MVGDDVRRLEGRRVYYSGVDRELLTSIRHQSVLYYQRHSALTSYISPYIKHSSMTNVNALVSFIWNRTGVRNPSFAMSHTAVLEFKFYAQVRYQPNNKVGITQDSC